MSDPWDGILDPNEEILWQGAPVGGVRLEWRSPAEAFGSIFGIGFSLFWMNTASEAPGAFWMFGLIFLAAGLHGLITIHFWRAFVRRHQHYTLTTERAMIGTDMFGRKTLKSYPINIRSELFLEQSEFVGDVFFAKREKKTKNGVTVTDIGFKRIESPQHVLALIQKVKDEKSS